MKWNGAWELRGERAICRWMIAWLDIDEAHVGCIGGYSGGGAFQLEKFVIRKNDFYLEANPSFSDLVSGDLIAKAEDCQDKVLSFHDEDTWLDFDNLVIKPTKKEFLNRQGDLLFGGDRLPADLFVLFDAVGLISRPVSKTQGEN